jgi:hypothetical protein
VVHNDDLLCEQQRELARLRDLSYFVRGTVGFKLLRTVGGRPLPLAAWQVLDRYVLPNWDGPKPIGARVHWVDPFPDETECVWWWGDARAVDDFQAWADHTAIALWGARDSLPQLSTERGYYGTLKTFCTLGRVVERRVTLPPRAGPPAQFFLRDVPGDAFAFSEKVLERLVGSASRSSMARPSQQLPTYDPVDRDLRVGAAVSRHYNKDNRHEVILKAFQRNRWKHRIRVPSLFSDPKVLRDTIDQLNTPQKNKPMPIHFGLDAWHLVWNWRNET